MKGLVHERALRSDERIQQEYKTYVDQLTTPPGSIDKEIQQEAARTAGMTLVEYRRAILAHRDDPAVRDVAWWISAAEHMTDDDITGMYLPDVALDTPLRPILTHEHDTEPSTFRDVVDAHTGPVHVVLGSFT